MFIKKQKQNGFILAVVLIGLVALTLGVLSFYKTSRNHSTLTESEIREKQLRLEALVAFDNIKKNIGTAFTTLAQSTPVSTTPLTTYTSIRQPIPLTNDISVSVRCIGQGRGGIGTGYRAGVCNMSFATDAFPKILSVMLAKRDKARPGAMVQVSSTVEINPNLLNTYSTLLTNIYPMMPFTMGEGHIGGNVGFFKNASDSERLKVVFSNRNGPLTIEGSFVTSEDTDFFYGTWPWDPNHSFPIGQVRLEHGHKTGVNPAQGLQQHFSDALGLSTNYVAETNQGLLPPTENVLGVSYHAVNAPATFKFGRLNSSSCTLRAEAPVARVQSRMMREGETYGPGQGLPLLQQTSIANGGNGLYDRWLADPVHTRCEFDTQTPTNESNGFRWMWVCNEDTEPRPFRKANAPTVQLNGLAPVPDESVIVTSSIKNTVKPLNPSDNFAETCGPNNFTLISNRSPFEFTTSLERTPVGSEVINTGNVAFVGAPAGTFGEFPGVLLTGATKLLNGATLSNVRNGIEVAPDENSHLPSAPNGESFRIDAAVVTTNRPGFYGIYGAIEMSNDLLQLQDPYRSFGKIEIHGSEIAPGVSKLRSGNSEGNIMAGFQNVVRTFMPSQAPLLDARITADFLVTTTSLKVENADLLAAMAELGLTWIGQARREVTSEAPDEAALPPGGGMPGGGTPPVGGGGVVLNPSGMQGGHLEFGGGGEGGGSNNGGSGVHVFGGGGLYGELPGGENP